MRAADFTGLAISDLPLDATETEQGVRDMLYGIIRALEPMLVVETGTYKGAATWHLGCAVNKYGGRVISCETNPGYVRIARAHVDGLPVEVRQCMSAAVPELADADLLFLDSDYKYRREEIERAKRGATIVVHDVYKSYDPTIEPLAPLIESLGGLCFRCGIEGRGFGILIKR